MDQHHGFDGTLLNHQECWFDAGFARVFIMLVSDGYTISVENEHPFNSYRHVHQGTTSLSHCQILQVGG